MLFSKMATSGTPLRFESFLRAYNASIKLLRSLTFSTTSELPQASQHFHSNSNSRILSRVSLFPLTRKQAHSIGAGALFKNSSGCKDFLTRQNQFSSLIKLFHTSSRSFGTKVGTQIKGSPQKNTSVLIYLFAIFILMIGGTYAGVPLYKVFCQATGLGGQAVQELDSEKIESMQKVERQIKIRFNADVASSMRWNFKPQQTEVTVFPGETALAFYTAKNPTDKPIIGISTYNVLPFDAGQYFNKIQCFCFEEQRLNPKEQVDMPVFFYIDPEFVEDPKLEHVETIHLSYTFFEATDGLTLPLPGYPQPHHPVPATA